MFLIFCNTYKQSTSNIYWKNQSRGPLWMEEKARPNVISNICFLVAQKPLHTSGRAQNFDYFVPLTAFTEQGGRTNNWLLGEPTSLFTKRVNVLFLAFLLYFYSCRWFNKLAQCLQSDTIQRINC